MKELFGKIDVWKKCKNKILLDISVDLPILGMRLTIPLAVLQMEDGESIYPAKLPLVTWLFLWG